MRKISIIILALVFLSCESDPIDAGVETTVQGIIYDSRNDIPFQNLKLKVAEYKDDTQSGIYHTLRFIQWIDSTHTDSEGNYSLNFKTSGRGDRYKLHAESEQDIWYYNNRVVDIGIGKDVNLDFNFLHLYPIKLVIEMNNINHLPISGSTGYYPKMEAINTANGKVERKIYTDKNSDTQIYFSRKVAANTYESYTHIIPASNTSELTTYNLTLNNSDFKPTN
jgi:hypothetical protein